VSLDAPLVLGQLPECGVPDCRELASPRGGQQGVVVTVSAGARRLQLQTYAFTCVQHTEEFMQITRAGGQVG
jgi:hypothetical protein